MLYNKIETVFNRDVNGTKKLIDGDYRSPLVEYLKNNVWRWTEKIDGTNIRVIWDGHNITFGGRTEKAQIPADLVNFLNEKFKNIETEELFEQAFNDKEVVLFGEGYGPKIQNGGDYRSDVSFIMFDVAINERYQEWDNVLNIAKMFDVDVVPMVMEGTVEDAINFIKTHPKSNFGTAFMEGVVGKPLVEIFDRSGNRAIVKVKWEDFK